MAPLNVRQPVTGTRSGWRVASRGHPSYPLPPLPRRVLLIPSGINVHDEHSCFLAAAHIDDLQSIVAQGCDEKVMSI
jgi:hypothetical protein